MHPNIRSLLILTVCPKTRKDVTITLTDATVTVNNQQAPKDRIIEGKPSDCNMKNFCHSPKDPKCYLNTQKIKGKTIRYRAKKNKGV